MNLEAVYPDPSNPAIEFCFEELRAKHRGWLNRNWAAEPRQKQPTTDQSEVLSEPHSQKDQKRGFAIFQDTSAMTAPAQDQENASNQKSRGFNIFQDDSENKQPTPLAIDTSFKVLPVKDENDENKPPSKQDVEIVKRMRREERANRTRKIKVMDVEHVQKETQTVKLNMDSPTGRKIRKKKVAEPTMTINTREAMDEIYGIFSQPVQTGEEKESEESESDEDSDEDSDDDYSSGGEDTTTGHISAAGSDYGDETRREILASQQSSKEETPEDTDGGDEDGTSVSAWSDYDDSKPVLESTSATEQSKDEDDFSTPTEDVPTPHDDEYEEPKTRYVPIPPEGYEPVKSQYRDPVIVAQNRLPFMTPIVEHTESSIGAATIRAELEKGLVSKTPSRLKHNNIDVEEEDEDEDEDDENGLLSSPFQDVLSGAALEDKRRILQPVRTKTTKGIVSLSEDVAGVAAPKPKPLALRPAAPEPINKGPIIKDSQINPVDPEVRQTILSQIHPPLSTYEGYHEHKGVLHGRTPEIRKFSKAVGKGKTAAERNSASLPPAPVLEFQGTESTYTFKRELGAGAFAPVYLVENSRPSEDEKDGSAGDDNAAPARMGQGTFAAVKRHALEAVKMEDPPSAWEFYMLRQVHRRLGVSRATESVIHAYEMHMFKDEGFLIEEFRGQGTLLDLINVARAEAGGTLDESLAMFFAVELLRTVEALHSRGLVHGDLKGDNVLVRLDESPQWSSAYTRDGSAGWKNKGVSLIDFGRGIDMKVFAPGVQFVADWETSSADCAEMREMRPWTYQVDYHGLAGLLHSLLFGKYMSTIAERGAGLGQGATKHYKIKEGLKRYWQTGIWSEAFDLLLNPLMYTSAEEGGKMPLVKGLKGLRERMEDWLEQNCEKGIGLKTMIRKMEEAVKARKR